MKGGQGTHIASLMGRLSDASSVHTLVVCLIGTAFEAPSMIGSAGIDDRSSRSVRMLLLNDRFG